MKYCHFYRRHGLQQKYVWRIRRSVLLLFISQLNIRISPVEMKIYILSCLAAYSVTSQYFLRYLGSLSHTHNFALCYQLFFRDYAAIMINIMRATHFSAAHMLICAHFDTGLLNEVFMFSIINTQAQYIHMPFFHALNTFLLTSLKLY